jgi:N-acyl-D-amino-acid deacylase
VLRLTAALALALVAPAAADEPIYDLVLRGGRVVDGSGSPWFRADVAIRDDSIAAVSRHLSGRARRTIDVEGAVVAPGFIDIHSHARAIVKSPTAENYVRQGVTSLIEGPDGSSPVPLGAFLQQVAALPPAVNLGSMVGQGSIREKVVGLSDRAADDGEMEAMKALVREGMRDGALGLSTGLFYVPGAFTPTDEVTALARVAGAMGGIHISHMRNEAAGVLESVRETIEIGEGGGLPTQVTHHKIIGRPNWGKSVETLRLVAEARSRGVDVTIDQYPYTASMTALEVLIPVWAREGGRARLLERLRDTASRARIREAVADNIRNDRGGGDPENVRIAYCAWDASRAGKTLAALTREAGRAPTIEEAALVAIEMVERGETSAIFSAIAEPDLERILVSPFTMIASDGEIPVFGEGSPHPRSYGTFVRVLATYVREKKLLSLEEAVRKMSSFPAARLGLLDRGLLRPGFKADVAVFDPDRVRDVATFETPHRYAEGVSLVLVNGVPVLEDGRVTPARPGRILRGAGSVAYSLPSPPKRGSP